MEKKIIGANERKEFRSQSDSWIIELYFKVDNQNGRESINE